MNIALVSDSTCDLPYELVERYSIHIIPNVLIIEGESILDDASFSRETFYQQLPELESLPTTATASSGSYQEQYEGLFQQGIEQILSIHASSKLSGIFNAASLAAQEFGGRVHVIDSLQISMGLGFQVLAAAEALEEGLDLEAVLKKVRAVRQNTRLIAMIDTLEYIRRSGRISWARASLGALLRIKPFIEVKDGEVVRLGDARTRKKGIARLLELLEKQGPLACLAVLHTAAQADAEEFLRRASPELDTEPFIVNATTVIGTHVGPAALGFAAVLQE